jgi:hypothetical protein
MEVWRNTEPTNLPDLGFEEFATLGPGNGFSAVNTSGFGIAAHQPYKLEGGKSYQVTFDINLESGEPPVAMLDIGIWGNDTIIKNKALEGKNSFKVDVVKSEHYHPVFLVESGLDTKFTVKYFVIQELDDQQPAVSKP